MATIQDLTPLIGALYGFNVAFGVWDNFFDRLVSVFGRMPPIGGMAVEEEDSVGVRARVAEVRSMCRFSREISLAQGLCLVFAVVCTSALIYAGFDPEYELHLWSVIPLCPVLVAPIIATMVFAVRHWRKLEKNSKYQF